MPGNFNESLSEQAKRASDIIKQRDYDYFESGKKAIKHAEVEGVDLSKIESGIGYQGRYTRVPRVYDTDLDQRLYGVFSLLTGYDSQKFAHIVDHRVTVGQTFKGSSRIEVDEVNAGRACNLSLQGAHVVSVNLVPYINIAREGTTLITQNEKRDLRLGRTVVSDQYDDKQLEQAVYDSHRTWEATLIVGQEAVVAFAEVIQSERNREEYSVGIKGRSRIDVLSDLLSNHG